MPRRMSLQVALILLASALPAAASEEPRSFLRLSARAPGPPSEQLGVVAEQEVDVDRRALADRRVLLPLLDGRTYELVRTGMDLRPAGSFAWRGQLVDRDTGEEVGTATLTVAEDRDLVIGTISVSGTTYQIQPAAGGGHRLAVIDDSRLPPCGVTERSDLPDLLAPNAEGPGELHAVTAAAKPRPPKVPPTTTLRLLVLATPGAVTILRSFENLQNQVQHSVDLGNSAFANSKIPVTMQLAAVLRTDHVEGDAYDDLMWVALSPAVADLRRQWGATHVILLSGASRIGAFGICGIADLMRRDVYLDPTRTPQGSAIVLANCASGFTLIHEVGHTLGCEHDPAHGSPLPLALFPHAYGHFVDGSFRTIMSYSDQCELGCSAVPYFSNPTVRYNGVPTGIAGKRDNSAVISTVRARFTGPQAGGCVPGPNTLCLGGRYQVDVEWYDPWAIKLGRGKALKSAGSLGLFSFGDPNSVDLAMRLVDDGGGVSVSHAPLAGPYYELYLRDLQAGGHDYFTGFGESKCGGTERAFTTSSAASRTAAPAKKGAGGCRPDATTVCLHNRFAVRASWSDGNGVHQAAAAPLVPRNSTAFDFGDGGDPELIVKIAPAGRKFNLAYAPLVARSYTLTVTDTRTRAVKTYTQPEAKQCGGGESPAF